jgi:hypothetical protein
MGLFVGTVMRAVNLDWRLCTGMPNSGGCPAFQLTVHVPVVRVYIPGVRLFGQIMTMPEQRR